MPPDAEKTRWGFRIAYLAVLLLATLPPPVFDLTREGLSARLSGAFDLTFRGSDVIDAVRNVLLFAGWGAVWAASAPRSAARNAFLRTIVVATVVGSAISLSIESIQLLSPYRDTNIWDFITNTTGSALGAAVFLVLIRSIDRTRQDRSYVGLPAFVLAAGYGSAVLLEALIPLLAQGVVPGYGGGPLARAGRAFQHFSWSTLGDLPLLSAILVLPAGILTVAALAERGMGRTGARNRVLVLVVPVFAAVEVVGGILGQPISAGALVMHAAGVALGAWLADRFLPAFTQRLRGRQRPAAILAAYLAFLVLWSWRPFTFATSFAAIQDGLAVQQFIPLMSHAVRFDVFSALDIARQFALLIPVGALLAVWPLKARGLLAGPLPGIYAAVLLELGQILVDGRHFDMTDALVGSAAVLLGWVVVRRGGLRPWGEILDRR
ncbi:MAG: VanZ family protein [Gemmatimonadales bacterium]|nr:MAG: VanZ family protein [Gemmatimonadales bacterium]